MGYNYSREKRKFDAEWKKKEEWYRESGMSEEAIQEIFAYDWAEFNSTRKFYRYMEDVDVERVPKNPAIYLNPHWQRIGRNCLTHRRCYEESANYPQTT